MAEASARIQIPSEQGQEAGALVRIEPKKLPVVKPYSPSQEADKPYTGHGIILRHGGIELELPEGMAIGRVAELVKALSGV